MTALDLHSLAVQIERRFPRGGEPEHPVETGRGYELVDGRVAGQKNKVGQATFVRTLEEAAYLIDQGYWIRMGGPGKRASLISPKSLRVIRD